MRPSLVSGLPIIIHWRIYIFLFFIFVHCIERADLLSLFIFLSYFIVHSEHAGYSFLLHFLSNLRRHINMEKYISIVTPVFTITYKYIDHFRSYNIIRCEFTENLSVSIPVEIRISLPSRNLEPFAEAQNFLQQFQTSVDSQRKRFLYKPVTSRSQHKGQRRYDCA